MNQRNLRAGILTIGNEVLDGIIVDTNSNWIETKLIDLGVEMRRASTVRDDIEEIGAGLRFLMEECNIIVTSGGLGPTHDDMTLQAIGKALGLRMIENKEAIDMIQRRYSDLYLSKIIKTDEMTESRRKMGIVPEGSKLLRNGVGTAPGVRIDLNDKVIFCLPGVPSELKDIWEGSIRTWIEDNIREGYFQEIVELDFLDESIFAPIIQVVMDDVPGVWIKSMPKRYGTSRVMRVWVSARTSDLTEARKRVEEAVQALEKETGLQSRKVDQ